MFASVVEQPDAKQVEARRLALREDRRDVVAGEVARVEVEVAVLDRRERLAVSGEELTATVRRGSGVNSAGQASSCTGCR
jgi:hypothetical protein